MKNHPARSHAFLSRLHDGELEPSERAHFEAHRSHCKECRDAAADFERALSLFRSSRSSPPPKDLAMRVLRKVQTHAASRRTPFGDLFSVDLRWAGAFAAALLVLLVATPIVLRQQPKVVPVESPIPIALEDRAAPLSDKDKVAATKPDPAKQAVSDAPGTRSELGRLRASQMAQNSNEAPKRDEARPVQGAFSAVPEDLKREEKLAMGEVAAAKPAAEKAQAPAAPAPSAPASADARVPASNMNRQVAAAPGPPAAAAREAQGGEAARDQFSTSTEATLDRPARLVVQSIDALGSAPELDARSQGPFLNDLRGRSYIVLVDGQGRVTDAQETVSKKSAAAEPKRRDGALAKDREKERDNAAPASAALKNLRFKAGERQRKLLIRVE